MNRDNDATRALFTGSAKAEEAVGWSAYGLLIASVFTVALGYGVVLPISPLYLERVVGQDAQAIAWHLGTFTGIYTFALFVFGPLWGQFADTRGRRPAILLGLGGYLVALLLSAFPFGLWSAYAARALAGAFAASVIPAGLAYVADVCEPERRAARFVWIGGATLVGFLAGPALGSWLAGPIMGMNAAAMPTMTSIPFIVVAAIGIPVLIATYLRLPEPDRSLPRQSVQANTSLQAQPRLVWLSLVLALLATFGLGSFEVGLNLFSRQILKLDPSKVATMFAACSLVMVTAQAVLATPVAKRLLDYRTLVGAFVAGAIGLLFVSSGRELGGLLLIVGLFSASTGLIGPLLTYQLSLQAGSAQGTALSRQAAAGNLGQTLGSGVAGWLFSFVPEAPFWLAAGLLAIGAYLSVGMSKHEDGTDNGGLA